MWAQLKEYDRKGFHPDYRETSALVERWREDLFGADGSMTSMLVGSAT